MTGSHGRVPRAAVPRPRGAATGVPAEDNGRGDP
jgi:hypothetical protein